VSAVEDIGTGLGTRVAGSTRKLAYHVHHVSGKVVTVVQTALQTVERVRQVLEGSELSEVTDEVVGYLRLFQDRRSRLGRAAGEPLLLDTEMMADAFAGHFHREVFETVPMVSATTVAELLGPVSDVRGFMRRLRSRSEVVALKHKNSFVYPEFQFSAERRELRPVVAEVNRVLDSARDPWGTMAWWMASQPRWSGRRPLDHPDDRRLVALAAAGIDDGY
jgi:hypothetical protein